MDQETIRLLQRRIAGLAAGPSSLRNQGPRGTVERARKYLRQIDLSSYSASRRDSFESQLDDDTEGLRRSLFSKHRYWGSARKVLNIFMRNAVYDHHLRRHYGLRKIEPWLEVPLDSYVGIGLSNEQENQDLAEPLSWSSVSGLRAEDSDRFQDLAAVVAKRMRVSRVHLDLLYYRPEG